MTDLQVRKSSPEQQTQEPRPNMWKQVLGGVAIFVIVAGIVAAVTVRTAEPTGRSQAAIDAESARLNGLAEYIAGQEPAVMTELNDHVAQVQAIQAAQRQAQAELTAERSDADLAIEPRAPSVYYHERVLESLANRQPPVPSVSETADKVMLGYVEKASAATFDELEGADRVFQNLYWNSPAESTSHLGPAWEAYGDRYNAIAENLVEGDGPD